MLDIATRINPSLASIGLAAPFDWRLSLADAPANYAWATYNTPSGQREDYVEVLATYALALEDTLQTAITISLFSDRRAGPDEQLPFGARDRRGWPGDEFSADAYNGQIDSFGSLLWLCYSGKSAQEVLDRAQFYGREALAWMIRDGVAERVEVQSEWQGALQDRLALRVSIYQGASEQPVYDVLWGTTIRRGVQ